MSRRSSAPVKKPLKPIKILLAKTLSEDDNIDGWWASEKLDGIRAIWTGEKFISRYGNTLFAPEWFTESLPAMRLDGELWVGRGEFQRTSSYVRKHEPIDAEWEQVTYMAFDLPDVDLPFEARQELLHDAVDGLPWAKVVKQTRIKNRVQLRSKLKELFARGSEGLMLREPGSYYETKRSSTLFKVKQVLDAEAVIVGYKSGKGKYKGLLGAYEMQMPDGNEFELSGMDDVMRHDPLPIGTVVTYEYQELTDSGKPRHPRYLRVYEPV